MAHLRFACTFKQFSNKITQTSPDYAYFCKHHSKKQVLVTTFTIHNVTNKQLYFLVFQKKDPSN